ncbi:hypothetical protein [Vibrio phage VCPH]|nr:hypothetical protein [Vibrio phage VCPH]
MAILFAQNECIGYPADSVNGAFGSGDPRVDNDGTTARAGYQRKDMTGYGRSAGALFPVLNRVAVEDINSGQFWIHCRMSLGNIINGTKYIRFCDESNQSAAHWTLRAQSSRTVSFTYDGNGNGASVSTPSNSTYNGVFTIDVLIDLDSDEIVFYHDEVEVHRDVVSKPTNINVQDHFNAVLVHDDDMTISEVIFTHNEDTRGWRLVDLNPDSVGTHSEFSGDIANINTIGLTSDSMSASDEALATFNHGGFPSEITSDDYEVRAVLSGIVAEATSDSRVPVATPIMVVGSDIVEAPKYLFYGRDRTLTENSENTSILELNEVNHFTGQPWTIDEVKNMEIGFKAGGLSTVATGTVGLDSGYAGIMNYRSLQTLGSFSSQVPIVLPEEGNFDKPTIYLRGLIAYTSPSTYVRIFMGTTSTGNSADGTDDGQRPESADWGNLNRVDMTVLFDDGTMHKLVGGVASSAGDGNYYYNFGSVSGATDFAAKMESHVGSGVTVGMSFY